MKRFRKITLTLLGAALTACAAIGFTACDFEDEEAKSAYEVAVENGFVGTEIEWLRSLHGASGEDGADLDIEEVYEAAKKNGFKGTFQEFLKEYLSVDVGAENDTKMIAHNVMSTVSVYCGFKTKVKVSGGGFLGGETKYETRVSCAAGSGVIYDLDKENGNAYIITNYHVVYNASSDNGVADTIYVYTYGALNGFDTKTGTDETGDGIAVSYVGGAMNYDIAVLKIGGSEKLMNSHAEEAVLGDSNKIAVGQKVNVVGNPEGSGISVTSGMISVDSEYISLTGADDKTQVSFRVIRTDAAVNEGNSGGAMYNAQGKLVGIVNAKNVSSGIDNMGYALPITQAAAVAQNIIDNNVKQVKQARLGVTVRSTASSGFINDDGYVQIVETVAVEEITVGSAAAAAGLEKGDVFKSISLGDKTLQITRLFQSADFLLQVRFGDTVKLTVLRGGEEKTFSIRYDKEEYFETVA